MNDLNDPQRVSHVFFEVGGVLVERARFREYYAANLGRVMAARFGLPPAAWSAAYQHVLADWDSYYADLNLSGDDGIADMWEGMFRTTRALFRLAGRSEPDKPTLTTLARELPALAARGHEAFYDEAMDVLQALDEAGLVLGVVSHATSAQLEAMLEPVRHFFRGEIWGADNAERFEKDAQRYESAARRVGAAPEACLLVDTQAAALAGATQAGMQTAQLCRGESSTLTDLRGLIHFIGSRERRRR